MKLNKTDLLLLRTINSRFGTSTVSELFSELPAGLFATKRALSARLCEMRGRNLLQSATTENGVNEWELSAVGSAAIGSAAIAQDMTDAIGVPATEPVQTDSPDIIVEREPDPIAADFADTIAETTAAIVAELTSLRLNQSFCDDLNPAEVKDELAEEANALRLRRPLPRERDALYVLSVLIDRMGRDYPEMAYELTRVAAYIEGECA